MHTSSSTYRIHDVSAKADGLPYPGLADRYPYQGIARGVTVYLRTSATTSHGTLAIIVHLSNFTPLLDPAKSLPQCLGQIGRRLVNMPARARTALFASSPGSKVQRTVRVTGDAWFGGRDEGNVRIGDDIIGTGSVAETRRLELIGGQIR